MVSYSRHSISRKLKTLIFAALFLSMKGTAQTTVTNTGPQTPCSRVFTYLVCQTGGHAISHWDLALPACFLASDIEAVYLNGQVFNGWSIVVDPSCANVRVLKWDNIQVQPGQCKEFKVVFKRLSMVVATKWWSKWGTTCQEGTNMVRGPSCNPCTEIPLNVSFMLPTAKRSVNDVIVDWQTFGEQEVQEFMIEKNTGGQWEVVAKVASKAPGGNSTALLSYSYRETNASRKATQYRIKAVNINERFAYSSIVSVAASQQFGLTVYPNPAYEGKINVVFEGNMSKRNISMIDMNGRVIRKWNAYTNSSIEIGNLYPGIYTLQVSDIEKGTQHFEKIVVRN